MVFNVAAFFTALHVLITRRPIRARRIAYAAVFAVTFGSIFVFTRLGLLLDELLFRNYRKVSMIQPLFIIGFPRSGTTFLQKLLSLDEENFASIALPVARSFPDFTQGHWSARRGRPRPRRSRREVTQ